MTRGVGLLASVTAMASAVILVDQAVPLGPLRAAAGLVMTLVIPGVALMLATGTPLRCWGIVLAVPYSLALAAVGGIVMERLGLGLDLRSVLGWSLAVTLAATVLALLRTASRARVAAGGESWGPGAPGDGMQRP